MAKYLQRIKARKSRSEGMSVKSIKTTLGVSKSSVSRWVRDVDLTSYQRELLKKTESDGREIGRIKSLLIMKKRRSSMLEGFMLEGIKEISVLDDRDLLLTGLALYWGEGGKKNRRVEFCNSDPRMIKFLILWLKRCFNVSQSEFKCVVGINEIHNSREEIVRMYWSEITDIPLDQFRKTSFKKVNNKKVYENFDNHYGTLTVLVLKSTKLYYKIMSLIEGLSRVGDN